APIAIARRAGGNDFDGHRASQPRVGRAIDDAHAALPDQVFDLVVRERGADHGPCLLSSRAWQSCGFILGTISWGSPVDQFHDDERFTVALAHFVDGADMGTPRAVAGQPRLIGLRRACGCSSVDLLSTLVFPVPIHRMRGSPVKKTLIYTALTAA